MILNLHVVQEAHRLDATRLLNGAPGVVFVQNVTAERPDDGFETQKIEPKQRAVLVGSTIAIQVFRELLRHSAQIVPGPVLFRVRQPRRVEKVLIVEDDAHVAAPWQAALDAVVVEARQRRGRIRAFDSGIPFGFGRLFVAKFGSQASLDIVALPPDVGLQVLQVSSDAVTGVGFVVH